MIKIKNIKKVYIKSNQTFPSKCKPNEIYEDEIGKYYLVAEKDN